MTRPENKEPSREANPETQRPLQPLTKEFISKYGIEVRRNLRDNLLLGDWECSDSGKRRAAWSRKFAQRLFNLETVEDANELLGPWVQWGTAIRQFWSGYWNHNDGLSQDEINRKYQEFSTRFDKTEIPPEIKEYQGDLSEDELRHFARWEWEYLAVTKNIHNAINFIEGWPDAVTPNTVFMVQRILERAVPIRSELDEGTRTKPIAMRIEMNGEFYFGYSTDGMPPELGYPDTSSEQEWARWNQLKLGDRVNYRVTDGETNEVISIGSGKILGYDIFAYGDGMIFTPALGIIGIYVVNNRTGFLECVYLKDVRFEGEED